ncbi:hypothetical protein C6501_09695 [Candidatus Poribacteria bacterium]|nr:MAG: hypothetical protein C6501_09695 [Candidatus Poribacteria bacterium]
MSTVVAAELSVEDLEKIREIVNEVGGRLEKRITDVEVRLEKRIAEVETKLEKRITEVETKLEKRITETEGRLQKNFTELFAEQSKRLDFHGTLIITLIGALIAFVGVPLVLIAYQQNRRTQQDDTIKAQATEIQALREKIESLEKSLS